MKKIALILLLVLPLAINAQTDTAPLLRAEEAVQAALAHNFDIQLSRADATIAQQNNTKGNAGMLPTVNFIANETFTISAFQQKLSNGSEFNTLGAPFNVANAAVQLNWTLFDGRRMYIAKDRLEATESLGQLNLQAQVQQTTAQVLLAYFEVAQNQLQEAAIRELITLNESRLRIAKARLDAGFSGQTDALQAEIDLNQQQAALIGQQQAGRNAKRQLQLLMGQVGGPDFEVETIPDPSFVPDRSALLTQCMNQNPQLLSLQKNAAIADLLLAETHTLGKPRIVGTSQLIAQRSDNGAGFLLNNTQAGLNVGASLNIPIYAGGNIRRQQEVAELQTLQAATRVEAQKMQIEQVLDQQIDQYMAQKNILSLYETSITNARESLMVSTERFRTGQTNALEVQSAQNNLAQVLLQRNIARYNLQVAEIQIRLLSGTL
ncbi:MAG: TolC family protein [Lewinellaceae bacterium]|nr:TolC family protein [Lewinellaceae bacterium]